MERVASERVLDIFGGEMLISARVIKNPRTYKQCMVCGKYCKPGDPRLRIYGSGFKSDPKYVACECIKCALYAPHEKIKTALLDAGILEVKC